MYDFSSDKANTQIFFQQMRFGVANSFTRQLLKATIIPKQGNNKKIRENKKKRGSWENFFYESIYDIAPVK